MTVYLAMSFQFLLPHILVSVRLQKADTYKPALRVVQALRFRKLILRLVTQKMLVTRSPVILQ